MQVMVTFSFADCDTYKMKRLKLNSYVFKL